MDLNTIWKTTLAQIEIKLDSPATFKTFFAGTELISINETKAVIGVTNAYMQDWLKQRHASLIQKTLSHVANKELTLEFDLVESQSNSYLPKITKKELAQENTSTDNLLEVRDGIHRSVQEAIDKAGLNDRYKMTNFVVGNSNQFAHAAATAVLQNPGEIYNPLFLHGKTGVGKTHIAQAVGRQLIENNPKNKVLYVSSEGFLNDLLKAIRTKKTEEFRNRYRSIKMLIIDDIQLISKWVSAQDEFFNTFNALQMNGSHIILVSDRPPIEIKDLADRLKSRFQGGVVADIAEPEFELRLAILQNKAKEKSLLLPEYALQTIAKGIQGNIRELEGALQKVALFNQMKPTGDLTTEEINKIIGNDIASKQEKIKVPTIMKEVGKSFGVTVKDIKSRSRKAETALARQVVMYILREEFGYKLEDIAGFVNRNDHTTVIHAVDKIKSRILSTDSFKNQIVEIIKNINET